MSSVFHLTHTHEQPCGCDETKDLGTYSTQENGVKATARAMKLPGFRDHHEGFHLQEVVLDKDEWTDGFVTVPTPGDQDLSSREVLERLGRLVVVTEIVSRLAGIRLDRIASSMKEADGRRISRREVGEIATPLDVETMARVLVEIRDALAADETPS